jgi:hexosaminidase
MVSTVTIRVVKPPRRRRALAGPLAAVLAACLAALAGYGEAGAAPGILQVIPAPAAVEPAAGSFHIANGVAIVARGERAEPVASYLADLLDRTRGIRLLPSKTGAAAGGIRLSLDAAAAGSPEAYTLEVSRGGVEIRAADPRGLFYGAVTLWQLATADGAEAGPATIQALRIADGPRFGWRGLMLDSARHYQPPEFIRKLIDWMALHKLNVLHWHLTDDQGWRLEILEYPELTRVGAWRKPAGAGNPPSYGGFYTQAEVRELVAYAASRFVTIVPEIEMPGHAQAAIASDPRLGTGGAPPVSPDWGVHDWLFNADESTLVFLDNVLDEVIDLFPGEFIHVGGDEAVKDRWRASPRVQARIRELGLADEAALQGWFIARIGRFLDARGRRLIGWDEILETGIPARAAVMSWRGTDGGIAAARAGHDVVMAPSPVLYLDHWQSDSPREPPGRPGIVSLADVYAFEPVPAELAPVEARRILGAQVNAWTEHMRLPERVEHQVFPRAAALAEATWSPPAARNWDSFMARLGAQFARYRRLGIRFADSAFEPRFALAAATDGGALRVTLSQQSPYGTIRLTRDGSVPGLASEPYAGPFDAPAGSLLRAAAFDGELALSEVVSLTADRAALRRRTDEELAQCSGKLVLRLEDDAPPGADRAVFNVDIVDPCWVWRDVDLTRGASLTAAVGQVPFNFQIGRDAEAIRRGDARSKDGELEIRTGDCAGEPAARLPLAAAAANDGVTVIGPVRIAPQAGRGDLCLRFARPRIDPIWTLSWVALGE